MADNGNIGLDDLDSLPTHPRYHVVILGSDDHVLRMERITAQTDEEALNHARVLVDGHAVELWDGVRFIEHFKPAD